MHARIQRGGDPFSSQSMFFLNKIGLSHELKQNQAEDKEHSRSIPGDAWTTNPIISRWSFLQWVTVHPLSNIEWQPK